MLTTFEMETLSRVKVTIDKPIQEYALDFLAIFNMSRESHKFLRVKNNRGNDVFVYCYEDDTNSIVNYLSNFGEVSVSSVKVALVDEESITDYVFNHNLEDNYKGAILLDY